MTNLLLIESPGKLKKLSQILGSGWIVKASMGHVRELTNDGEDALGFDLDLEGDRIHCRYVPRDDRAKKVLAELRRAVQQADRVYIATDPDREGETIGWHLQQALRLKQPQRVVYSEITPEAVRKAIAQPRSLDGNLIAAGRARDCLDKLVGYKGSRHVVWPLNNGAKSMGRVQSATLHLLCQREREIQAFVPQDYWSVWVLYANGIKAFYRRGASGGNVSRRGTGKTGAAAMTSTHHSTGAFSQNGANVKDEAQDQETVAESDRVTSAAEAERLVAIARSHPHTVIKVEGKTHKQSPPPPFITSTLQQAAGQRLRFSPEQTMKVAQALYEAGHITYMRTDSVALAAPFCQAVKQYLTQHDPDNLPKRVTSHRSSKGSQEAHEAIRPTHVEQTPQLIQSLTADQARLYDLIWNRAVASLCCPATLRKTRIVTQAGETFWEARGQVVEVPGYTRYWNNLKVDIQLPPVQPGQTLTLKQADAEKKQTQPPPRYTEAKLVQVMERKGIGRPSTYAPTIKVLRSRTYVQLVKGKLQPTTLGLDLDAALSILLPDLLQPEFTAQMEAKLDAIAHGQQDWQSYLTGWHRSYFAPAITQAKTKVMGGEIQQILHPQFIKREQETTGISDRSFLIQEARLTTAAPTSSHPVAITTKAQPLNHQPSSSGAKSSPTLCPKCKAGMSKIPSKSKKMKSNHFLKCQTPGCGTVMFWNSRQKQYELPYSQRQPDPQTFTDYPCPVCGAWLQRHGYEREGQRKEMLRCSLLEHRRGKCKDVAFFQTKNGFWSPKFGNLQVRVPTKS